MKRREKILLGAAAVLAVSWVVYANAGALGGGPFSALDREIVQLKAERDDLKDLVGRQPAMIAEWDQIARRTLADNDKDGHRLLDVELKRLIRETRLTQISAGAPAFRGKPGRVGTLTKQIVVEGKQEDLVRFLERFHEFPFPVRIDSMTLGPSAKSRSNDLRLTAKVETIILPETKLGGKIVPWDPEDPSLGEPIMQVASSDEQLKQIWEKNIFAPYVPPPPKPKPSPDGAVTERPSRHTPTPPPQPTRPRDKGEISSLLAGLGWQAIRVRDGRNVRTYKVGDDVADGKLVYVHPYGAIIRIDGTDYLYPIGAALENEKDRYEVDKVPAVREDLRRLREADEGVNLPEKQASG